MNPPTLIWKILHLGCLGKAAFVVLLSRAAGRRRHPIDGGPTPSPVRVRPAAGAIPSFAAANCGGHNGLLPPVMSPAPPFPHHDIAVFIPNEFRQTLSLSLTLRHCPN